MKWKFPYIYPTVGQMEGVLTSSVIINNMNVRHSYKCK